MGAVDKLNSVIGWTILESESDLKNWVILNPSGVTQRKYNER